MQKWNEEESEAMKGYILYATNLLNSDSRAEFELDAISETSLNALLDYLRIATDDLTPSEARAYYLKK